MARGASEEEWDPVDVAERARRYDPDAFAALFDRYFEKMRRYVYYHTGDPDLADELAAEVFRQALDSIATFDDRGGTIGAWLYGVARNVLASHFRTSRRGQQCEALDETLAGPEGEGPEVTVLERLTHEQLYRAIARLPREQRDVVIPRFIEGYRVDTVASILGKRPGAVRAQQHRAIGALRRMFEAEENGECETGMAY